VAGIRNRRAMQRRHGLLTRGRADNADMSLDTCRRLSAETPLRSRQMPTNVGDVGDVGMQKEHGSGRLWRRSRASVIIKTSHMAWPPHPRRRLIADQVPRLDVNRLERGGWLTPGTTSEWRYPTNPPLAVGLRAELKHAVITVGGVAIAVELVRQDRHLGGTQAYWRCPARCGRLRRYLYIVRGRLACLHCHRIRRRGHCEWRNPKPYQAAKLRARLGAEPGIGGAPPPRPYKCRSDYYEAWLRALAALEAEALAAFRDKLTELEREKERHDV
jgi:hypothetical protein